MNPLNLLLDFIYPPRCLVCKQGGAVVHSDCRSKLPYVAEPFCHRCSQKLTDRYCHSVLCSLPPEKLALTGVRSVFWHEGGGQEVVLRLKYRGVASLRDWAGTEAAHALERYQLAGHFDLILPVPLHAKRLRERGYNQSEIVARALARRLKKPLSTGELVRTRETHSQVKLGGQQRAGNVRHAFSWQGRSLAGQKVLIFDDVCTTGATLNECAQALRPANPAEIWAITLTREVFKPHKD